jgi:hypothetical protein
MKKIFLTMALAVGLMATAQVKIGNDPTNINAASLLELENSSGTKQGLLLPRVALVSTLTPTLDGGLNVEGMTVYNTATAGDVTPGLYTNDGSKWVKVGKIPVLKLKIVTGTIFAFTNTAVVLTLPDASLYTNKVLYIRNESGSSVSYVTTMPVAITNITATGAQQVFSNGSEWHLIAGKN